MKKTLKTKIMSVILTLILTLSISPICSASAAETQKIVLGDANGDGAISILDATEVQKLIASEKSMTDTQELTTDVNEDGTTSIMDATDIQKYIVGDTDNNIGKTWSDAVTKTVTHPAETAKTTKLRYAYLTVNVCNACDTPFIDTTTGKSSSEKYDKHHNATGHSGYRTQYDWYYVDDNNIYHDLDDDGHVPHKTTENAWENEKNVFDPEFDPYGDWVAIDAYNSTHDDQYSMTSTIWSYCHCCNADGTSIFDEWGGIGNYKKEGYLTLTDPVEITIYPDAVADRDAYEKAYNDALTTVKNHKTYHADKGDLPDYLGGHVDASVAEKDKIYKTSETVIKDAWTETVTIRDAGWY